MIQDVERTRQEAHAPYVDWFGDGSVAVLDLALACCAVESEVAPGAGVRRWTTPPPGARVVVVASGTLTDAEAGMFQEAVAGIADPMVVAFGGCACVGGPYWDSYAVTKGIDQLVPVDAYVPGCPPPPGALAEVIDRLRDGVPAAPVPGDARE